MIRHMLSLLTGTLVVAVMALSGCMTRNAPQVQYFSLLTIEQLGSSQQVVSRPDLRLGIGPVTVVDSLKQRQIVTRKQGNQYDFDEFNRWAGELEKDLEVVTGNNLGFLLGTGSVDYFPWLSHFVPTQRIILDVQRLDGDLAGEAVLEARWSVVAPDGRTTLAANRSVYRRPLNDAGYAALVETESLLLADLSLEIARAVAAAVAGTAPAAQ